MLLTNLRKSTLFETLVLKLTYLCSLKYIRLQKKKNKIVEILLSTILCIVVNNFFNLTVKIRHGHTAVQSLGEVLYATAVSILESGKTPK